MGAQNRMKQMYDSRHQERHFEVGDLVFFHLQEYRQQSLHRRVNKKLSPKFVGSYRATEKVGPVAYRLALPPKTKLHNVLHVSVLKKWIGNKVPIQEELPTLADEANVLNPQVVLECRSSPKSDKVLIHLHNHSPADATWELRAELSKRFPNFNLEDKVQLKGKGVLWLHEGPTKEVAHGLDVLKEG
jgi:hypothetical protein